MSKRELPPHHTDVLYYRNNAISQYLTTNPASKRAAAAAKMGSSSLIVVEYIGMQINWPWALMDIHLRNILLWPTIVVGSCLFHEEEQDVIWLLLSNWGPVSLLMKMKTILETVESLWVENDFVFFRPYGLQKHMMSHQTVIYLA